MEDNFAGRTYIVTGATSGIGQSVSMKLAEAGANVVLVGRDKSMLERVEQMLTPANHKAVICDLTQTDRIDEAISSVIKTHGRIGGLVHCAGIYDHKPLKFVTAELLNAHMQVNCHSFIEIIRVLSRKANRAPNASAVAISTIAAAVPYASFLAYATSKCALDMAVKIMAIELQGKMRINSIRPAGVLMRGDSKNQSAAATLCDDAVHNEPIHPDEVADLAFYLLSERSRSINGANIPINQSAIF